MSQPLVAAALMFLAASSLAASGFFGKLAMYYISIYLAVTSRFLVPLVLTTLWFLVTGQLREVRRNEFVASIPRGLALCLSQYFLYFTMLRTTLAEATILYNTGPLFISLHSFWRQGRISRIRLTALVLGFLGVALMMGLGEMQASRYLVAGVLSGFFQSVSQILLHRATRKMGTTFVMFYVYLVGTLAWGAYLLLAHVPLRLEVGSAPVAVMALWLLLAALGSMGNQQFRGEAYRRVEDPAVLSPLIYVTVFVSGLLDWLIFHKIPSLQTLCGGALVMSGAIFILWDKDEPSRKS